MVKYRVEAFPFSTAAMYAAMIVADYTLLGSSRKNVMKAFVGMAKWLAETRLVEKDGYIFIVPDSLDHKKLARVMAITAGIPLDAGDAQYIASGVNRVLELMQEDDRPFSIRSIEYFSDVASNILLPAYSPETKLEFAVTKHAAVLYASYLNGRLLRKNDAVEKALSERPMPLSP